MWVSSTSITSFVVLEFFSGYFLRVLGDMGISFKVKRLGASDSLLSKLQLLVLFLFSLDFFWGYKPWGDHFLRRWDSHFGFWCTNENREILWRFPWSDDHFFSRIQFFFGSLGFFFYWRFFSGGWKPRGRLFLRRREKRCRFTSCKFWSFCGLDFFCSVSNKKWNIRVFSVLKVETVLSNRTVIKFSFFFRFGSEHFELAEYSLCRSAYSFFCFPKLPAYFLSIVSNRPDVVGTIRLYARPCFFGFIKSDEIRVLGYYIFLG